MFGSEPNLSPEYSAVVGSLDFKQSKAPLPSAYGSSSLAFHSAGLSEKKAA